MTHPNNDFIKRFLGEDKVSPEQQKALLKKQRMENYYKSLEQKNILVEENKKAIDYTTKKIFSNTKPKTLVDLQEAKKAAAQWIEKLTPYGVFFYNKEQDVWMNNFGVIKKTLDELIQMVSSGYEIVSGGSNETQTIQSFFSDSGSKLALFNSSEETVSVYGISYSPTVSTTLLNTVNVGGVPFSAASNEKCFVSDDGEYLVLSSPNNKSVYFFDVNEDALLQTVTENYSNFGSKIAIDKDFYGMAISTYDLTRSVDEYDGRNTSYEISSPVCYYKRNFNSSNIQQFKKIHTANTYTHSRSNGFSSLAGAFNLINGGVLNWDEGAVGSIISTVGVNRCDDIVCKGYNFSHTSIALEQDQIIYRSKFPNASNKKYDILKVPGITFKSSYSYNTMFKTLNATGSYNYAFAQSIPWKVNSDEYMADQNSSNFFMMGCSNLKNFSIVRKINSNFIYDSSYSSAYSISSLNIPILKETLDTIPDFAFRRTIAGYCGSYMDLAQTREIFYSLNNHLPTTASNGGWDGYERSQFIREEVTSAKIAINTTDVYNINQVITKSKTQGPATNIISQNLNINNLRIYRYPNTNATGTDSFDYSDWVRDNNNGWTASPNIQPYGIIKFLYKSSDQSNLNVAMNDEHYYTNHQSNFLNNPTKFSEAEFAISVNDAILNDTVQNCFASDDRLFVNFLNTTLIFKIDKSFYYNPLILETTLNFSLNTYSFTFNNQGEYFSKNNVLYKYNRTTKILDIVSTVT